MSMTWLPTARADDTLSGMTMVNPFPGMNPYFEQEWRDAHRMLIGASGLVPP